MGKSSRVLHRRQGTETAEGQLPAHEKGLAGSARRMASAHHDRRGENARGFIPGTNTSKNYSRRLPSSVSSSAQTQYSSTFRQQRAMSIRSKIGGNELAPASRSTSVIAKGHLSEAAMKFMLLSAPFVFTFVLIGSASSSAQAQAAWQVDTRSNAGPIAQVHLTPKSRKPGALKSGAGGSIQTGRGHLV